MKPTSIIFLIFSVILVIAGTGLCKISETMAKDENYELFIQSVNEDGDLITACDLTNSSLTKLKLNLNDADVHVISGAEEAKVELVNFPINTFTHLYANGVMTIDDNVSLLTLFNLTGQGEQFLGLRHYLNTANFEKKEKAVNVYLTDDIELQELEIKSLRSDITVEDCAASLSYKLSTDVGNITLNNVSDAETADLSITEEGTVTVQWSAVTDINVEILKGTCAYVAKQANVQTYSANCEAGNVFVDGNNCGPAYNATSAATLVTCRFNVTEGDIIISELS